MTHWRLILARLPLPMLALAASYGVYSFAQLFVPLGVAIIQAAAFELTYIGLAVTRDLSKDDRRRATTISIGAVVASIIYNTLAGWFHKQPALLETASPIAWLMFAILHGAPLAWVAYLVADLLLHSSAQTTLETLPARLSASKQADQAVAARARYECSGASNGSGAARSAADVARSPLFVRPLRKRAIKQTSKGERDALRLC
jgi:hypothetical protein